MKKNLMLSWMPQDMELDNFYKDMDNFLDKYLCHRIKENKDNLIGSKIISDPLIGYIHFDPLEIYIIDTPLFQRLRGIKQLGLADLVFPSLGYSRFEHSLGVVGRMNQLLNKIRENNRENDDDIGKIIDKYRFSIRLAALLHDIGHCIFSHCSERVIKELIYTNPEEEYKLSANKIQEKFSNHFKKYSKIPFAEIFTLSIIGSKKFFEFVKSSDLCGLGETKLTTQLEWTAYFTLGLPVKENPDSVFLSQLMSSGLDVDKIDYMSREQHYSGIRLQIDLDRILSKLKVFNIDHYELPTNLHHLKKVFTANQKLKVLGFAKGGQFAFEEFCIARLALHVKIYLHQKVRLAESQLAQYIYDLSNLDFLQNPVNWLYLTEDIIKFPHVVLSDLTNNKNLLNYGYLTKEVEENLKRIHNRDLYVRTFSFGVINSKNKVNFDELEVEMDFFKQYLTDNKLREKILSETVEIKKVLEVDIENIKENNFIIDLPRLINIQQGQESLYFEKVSSIPTKWTIPIDKIMSYFQENRALGYVFSNIKTAWLLCIASEKVFFDEYGQIFEQESFISKNVYKDYIYYKKQLNQINYYDKYPKLKPPSEYLVTAESTERINKILENLKSFKSLNDEVITLNRIITFVNQFPEDLQDVVLTFLDKLKIYNESLLVIEIEKLLNTIDIKNVGLSFLGGNTDSGSRFGYHLRDMIKKYNCEIKELDDNLVKNSESLIIFDDNINSGLQLINIFAELLDEKDKLPNNFVLDEKHIEPLINNEYKKKFKDIDIYLVYIVGFEGIEDKIKEWLSDYLGFNKEKIHIRIHELFRKDKKILSGTLSILEHEKKDDLKLFLENVGEQLLTNEKKNSEKIERCKLGYAKAEAMVLFPYNVPTMTITALWCKGVLKDNIPWVPLAERRRRHDKKGNLIGED